MSPRTTRLTIHSEYEAPRIRAVAANRPIQKLCSTAPMITMNSPTKPLVAGRPLLAIENRMKNVAKRGITLTTPP
ncbi:hypothetical protein G6F62_015922 [Rhizopus arrhizus]|nr:hypothetical protein G6F62_015922 [Rhizopus arrhizus]